MAAYKEIKGINIQKLSADPPAPIEGQVWYNTTSGVLKGFKYDPGTWSTGGNLNSARYSLAGAGTQTSALAFGGFQNTGGPLAVETFAGTESYDGTSWTEVNDLNTARYWLGNAGANNTSALAFGGDATGEIPEWFAGTESWNGTNWTEVNDLNAARYQLTGTGTNTAALAIGGFLNTGGSPEIFAGTESWNGTNWTEVNDLNTERRRLASASADNTTALAFGGASPLGTTSVTESWNGTNWTEVNDLNTARAYLAGAGTQTSALAFGGDQPPPTSGVTESWNGTSWTEVDDLNTARSHLAGDGADNTSALAFGGTTGGASFTNATEELNAGPATVSFGDA